MLGVPAAAGLDESVARSATPSIVIQPLPAHGAKVAQEAPRFTATSPAVFDERQACNDECEEYEQSDGTSHEST
jgi:hypothetical protein